MSLSPGRPPSTQTLVIARIESDLAAGRLRVGDCLPTVRDLASSLGCDPGTVMRAQQDLLDRGVVRREGKATRSRLVLCPLPTALLAGTVAVITTHRSGQLPPEPGWSVHEFAGVVEAAAAHGNPILVSAPDALDINRLRRLRRDGLIGLVVVGEGCEPAAAVVAAAMADGLPVALHAPLFEGLAVDRADSDHEAGGHLLAAHILGSGRRRLATLWPWNNGKKPDELPWGRARQAGIARACREVGVAPPQRRVWVGSYDYEDSIRACLDQIHDLVSGPQTVDALLMHSDGDVPWLIEALRRLDVAVHQHIAVAGYDHYWRREAGPGPCASLDKVNIAVGRTLVELVLDRAAGRLPREPQLRLVPPQLIVHDPISS